MVVIGRWFIGFFFCAISALAPCAVFYVGAGAGCQFADIQPAVNAAAANGQAVNTIRVARNRTYSAQHVVIQNQVILVLAGGYADCQQTVADNIPTVVSGGGGTADSVIEILGTGDVTLTDLKISDGDTPSNAIGGGITITGGPHIVSIFDTLIQSNSAGSGGGIAVSSNNASTQAISLLINENVFIAGNSATSTTGGGGGIYCNNATVNMVVQAGRLSGNSSAGKGGGLLANNCSMRLASADLLGLFLSNSANGSGGALSVSGANSVVDIFTVNADRPTILRDNRAEISAGAIEVFASARVTAWNTNFIGNTANAGGAVAVFDNDATPNASFEFDPVRSPPAGSVRCGAGVVCKEFRGNKASTNIGVITGGASTFLLSSGGSSAPIIAINEAIVRDNQGGSLAFANESSSLRFHTSAFFGNLTVNGPLISTPATTAALSLTDCSIAGNNLSPSATAAIVGAGPMTLLRVAALTTGKPLVRSTAPISAEYVIANDLSGTVPTVTNLQADPLFKDVANGNLRLRGDSPALDYAPLVAVNTLSIDLDDVVRPFDIPGVANEFGPRDVGAYETPNDALLQNGFE
jgi:hypothetical protein